MVVDSGVIADPDIVFFIAFQPGIVKYFRLVLQQRRVHEGIPVNLRLMNDARSADRRPLVICRYLSRSAVSPRAAIIRQWGECASVGKAA